MSHENEMAHEMVDLCDIFPSPENDKLYKPVDPSAPDIQQLANSISEHKVLEPLVITLDNYILSGHRRYAAARLVGLESVPCLREQFKREDDLDRFVLLLREHNRQREKSFDEKLREEIVSTDSGEAYVALIQQREQAAQVAPAPMKVKKRSRSAISSVKMEMLDAVLGVIDEMRAYLPISERSIHYQLVTNPVRRNTKTGLMYKNNNNSAADLSDLITRARADGTINWDHIGDETRPTKLWKVHGDVRSFLQQSVDGLFTGYWRNLMVSQPNHIELIIEKNTVLPFVSEVAARYTIPVTSTRGNSSKPPLWNIVKRFKESGKEKLVLILLSDFDSDGISITDSLVGYMLHDFANHGITEKTLHPVRAGLWKHQVEEMDNPPTSLEPNLKSSNYERFVDEHGTDCYELEAVSVLHLQKIVTEAIDSVIDIELFNAELEAEREDAAELQATRNNVQKILLGAI